MKTTRYVLVLMLAVIALSVHSQSKKTSISYINAFDNINHPEIAYWFCSKDQLQPKRYREKIDSLAKFSKYTLIFLTSRNGVDFYDTQAMYPVFKDLVTYAQSKGLKIALQLWDSKGTIPLEYTERAIQEGEVLLDENGAANYSTSAKHIRDKKLLIKSELFRVYVFKKTGDGFYDPLSLKDITGDCKATEQKETVDLKLSAGKNYKGYTAYILTQHYYNYASNHSPYPVEKLAGALKAYADIPFSGVGLDEYTNLRVATTWELKNGDTFRERLYSLPMSVVYKKQSGENLEQVLFNMRYAPTGKPEVRVRAINAYMALMRSGTMNMENAIYKYGKEIFGKDTFIGLHDTHHNYLDGDEIWQTGLNWWNVKRDYGHTDEHTPLPTQMGIGISYPRNAMYNMYYNKSLDNIFTKALTDLRYGIRTHYHAINDVQGWGVSVEKTEALEKINQVERAARLLNRFNPSFPKIKLLVVFGMEALSNWYPNAAQRGVTDISVNLGIEDKAKKIWEAGYLNALVPTDEINDGRLKLNAEGKPVLQGHTFDAMIFLYPQYAKENTLKFLENYVSKGGKLMIEGTATHDFDSRDVSSRWKKITDKAVSASFSIEEIAKLGVSKNTLEDGVINEDGSYTFTNIQSLKSGGSAHFSVSKNGVSYTGQYAGIAVIKFDDKGNLLKFSGSNFSVLKKNGQEIFSLNKPADVYLELKDNDWTISIANDSGQIKVNANKL